jgi:hypothetical protein
VESQASKTHADHQDIGAAVGTQFQRDSLQRKIGADPA